MQKGARYLILMSTLAVLSCEPPVASTGDKAFDECVAGLENKPRQRFCSSALSRGEIPKNARLNAVQSVGNLKTPPALEQWSSIGPNPIIDNLHFREPTAVSGAAFVLEVSPHNDNVIYLGAASSGLWKSEDKGKTWKPLLLDKSLPVHAIGSIAFDPLSPDIIYAGTGAPTHAPDNYAGVGILKSTDQGKTWRLVGSDVFANLSISGIYIDPRNPKRVLAATIQGNRVLPVGDSLAGAFLSSDGGETWKRLLSGVDVWSVVVNPANFDEQYWIAYDNHPWNTPLVLKTDDAGETRSAKLPGSNKWFPESFAWHGSAKATIGGSSLFLSFAQDNKVLAIWQIENAFTSSPKYTPIEANVDLCHGCTWAHAIGVNPHDLNYLFFGGVSLWRYDLRSKTWTDLALRSNSFNSSTYYDQHYLSWNRTGTELYLVNDAGPWKSLDKGSTFETLASGLRLTQFWAGSVSDDGNWVVGGTQDQGVIRIDLRDANAQWTKIQTGDGFSTFFSDPAGLFFRRISAAYTLQFLQVFRDDKVKNVNGLSNGPFHSRLEKCPWNQDVVIAASNNGIFRNDHFFSGRLCADPKFCSAWFPQANTTQPVTAMAFLPVAKDCTSYVIATRFGELLLTSDAGTTWHDLDVYDEISNRQINDIEFDPQDPSGKSFFMALSGFGPHHIVHVKIIDVPNLFFSTSRIGSFRDIGPAIDIPFQALAIDERRDRLYAGSDVGMFLLEGLSDCKNSGECMWSHYGPKSGLPYVVVSDIGFDASKNTVVAFTHSSGAYKLDLR